MTTEGVLALVGRAKRREEEEQVKRRPIAAAKQRVAMQFVDVLLLISCSLCNVSSSFMCILTSHETRS